jgi:hypothetical protein
VRLVVDISDARTRTIVWQAWPAQTSGQPTSRRVATRRSRRRRRRCSRTTRRSADGAIRFAGPVSGCEISRELRLGRILEPTLLQPQIELRACEDDAWRPASCTSDIRAGPPMVSRSIEPRSVETAPGGLLVGSHRPRSRLDGVRSARGATPYADTSAVVRARQSVSRSHRAAARLRGVDRRPHTLAAGGPQSPLEQ